MTTDGVIIIEEGPEESPVSFESAPAEMEVSVFNVRVCIFQSVGSAERCCSMRALQQDMEEMKRVNDALQTENQSLREQLHAARSGNANIRTRPSRTPFFPLTVCSTRVRWGGA